MKEFVRFGARVWSEFPEEKKEPYRILAEVEKLRYERERNAALNGVNNP